MALRLANAEVLPFDSRVLRGARSATSSGGWTTSRALADDLDPARSSKRVRALRAAAGG